VADDVRALEPEGIQERHLVGGERLAVVAASRGIGPAEAAQVGREEPVLAAQPGDHLPPHVPMLRPSVQQEHRGRVRGPGLGHVHPDAVRLHESVLDAGDRRDLVSHQTQSICE
jgi:hypothetical protein